jgi:hypothetical protein
MASRLGDWEAVDRSLEMKGNSSLGHLVEESCQDLERQMEEEAFLVTIISTARKKTSRFIYLEILKEGVESLVQVVEALA